ncbi:MAG: hypothetical protein RJB66_1641 [Pseudomonadota bacterium]|jgi:fucose permease
MTKQQSYFIIAMAYLSLFGLGLADTLRGALFPEILIKYTLSNSQGSWFFITTSLFSIVAGYSSHSLARAISLFNTWRAGVLFMGLGSLGIYLASNFSLVLIGCATLGIGFGILSVTQNILITKVSPKRLTKKLLSGLHSMYGLASFFAPLMVAQFASRGLSWPLLFLWAGLIVFLLLAISFRIRSPRIPDDPPAEDHQNQRFFTKPQLLFAFMVGSYVAMEILVTTRLTSYLTQNLNWSIEAASTYLTYFFISLLTGRFLFSILHFPLSTKKTLLISLVGSMILNLLGLHLHPIYLTLTGLFMAPFYPVAMAFLAERFPQKLSPMIGLIIAFQSSFVILMNLLMGQLTDLYGIQIAMNSAFAFGGLSWFLLMFI